MMWAEHEGFCHDIEMWAEHEGFCHDIEGVLYKRSESAVYVQVGHVSVLAMRQVAFTACLLLHSSGCSISDESSF